MATISRGDRYLKKLPLSTSTFDADTAVKIFNNSGEDMGIPYADFNSAILTALAGIARTYIARTQTMTDADIAAVAGTLYDYPPNVLTVDRFVILTDLTEEGDVIQVSNRCEDNRIIKFTGGTVYNIYDEAVPYVLAKSLSEIRLIRSVYRIFLK